MRRRGRPAGAPGLGRQKGRGGEDGRLGRWVWVDKGLGWSGTEAPRRLVLLRREREEVGHGERHHAGRLGLADHRERLARAAARARGAGRDKQPGVARGLSDVTAGSAADARLDGPGSRRAVREARAVEALDDGGDDAADALLVDLLRARGLVVRVVELVRLVLGLVESEVVEAAHLVVGVVREDLVRVLDLEHLGRAAARLLGRERTDAHADHHLLRAKLAVVAVPQRSGGRRAQAVRAGH
eukprot:2726975-Prymnesium_polylepis.1